MRPKQRRVKLMIFEVWNASRAVALAGLVVIGFLAAPVLPARAQVGVGTSTADDDSTPGTKAYKLDSGDKVKVTVYGEDDLSGEFSVDGSGNVRLPLIGQVHAAGLTLHDFESAIEARLSKGYLLNPKVSAEVTNYRPFTILGEVNKPGEYPFENDMTVLNAVALGGGYTYRADQTTVYVRHKGSLKEESAPADDRTRIYPGDTIRVDEKIF
jgi:protein involved in polysaccharide export with SLBB domain